MRIRILIGKISNDKTESVSIITKSFIDGLNGKFKLIPFKSPRGEPNRKGGKLTFGNLYYSAIEILKWCFLLATKSPHIVHYPITSFWNAEKSLVFLFFAKLFNAKVIGHLHGGAFIKFWSDLPLIRRKWILLGLKRLDALVVLSPGWKRKIIEHIGIEKKYLHVVTNPIEESLEREGLGNIYNANSNIILCLGVMGREKGVFDILQAAIKLQEDKSSAKILLCGPEREPKIFSAIEKFIRDNCLRNVKVLKRGILGKEKIEIFRSSFALLLPSYIENFSLVVLEAAAFGMPLIVTPVGATPEFFVNGKSSLFIETNNPQDIAEKITYLFNNKKRAIRIGREAKKTYLTFLSREIAMSSLENVYRQVYMTRNE